MPITASLQEVIIGAVIVRPEVYWRINEKLSSEMFDVPWIRSVWSTIT